MNTSLDFECSERTWPSLTRCTSILSLYSDRVFEVPVQTVCFFDQKHATRASAFEVRHLLAELFTSGCFCGLYVFERAYHFETVAIGIRAQ